MTNYPRAFVGGGTAWWLFDHGLDRSWMGYRIYIQLNIKGDITGYIHGIETKKKSNEEHKAPAIADPMSSL